MVFTRMLGHQVTSFLNDLENMWDGPPLQVADCSTTGRDLFFRGHIAHVLCPSKCHENIGAQVVGSSIHPKVSAVCNAAIVDGVLPVSGGKLIVTETEGLPSYKGVENGPGASESGANIQEEAFHMYSPDNIDQISSDVRLVDKNGFLSSKGRLELRTDQGWGSVCGINHFGAQAACHQLGYDNGFALPFANCQKEHNCGALFTPVAAKDIECPANSEAITGCQRKMADDICASHKFDAIVKCTNQDQVYAIQKGQVRLVNGSKGRVSGGTGVLEMYDGFEWKPVSRRGFTQADAMVVCRQLGFEGVHPVAVPPKCETLEGRNECGMDPPGIENVHCTGSENSMFKCSYEVIKKGKTRHVAPNMNVVVQCAGKAGISSGCPYKEPAPAFEPAAFPKLDLSCNSTLESTRLAKAPAGTMVIAKCPSGCAKGPIEGTTVYTPKTPICTAAQHAGVTDGSGGHVVVEVGHGQEVHHGSQAHGIESNDAIGTGKSFLVSIPTSEVLSRVAKRPATVYAGSSSSGSPLDTIMS